jgi:hypothetical protein
MATGHRVWAKTARRPIPPVLPKARHEDREYIDRWGERYLVIWNDRPGDPSLTTYPTTEAVSS